MSIFIAMKDRTPEQLKAMNEGQHQKEVVVWFWNKYKDLRGLLYHNYSNPKNKIDGAMLVGLGLIKGNPDLTLAVPKFKSRFGALYLEMKKVGENPRPDQIKQMSKLEAAGYCVKWADNYIDAIKIIEEYLSLE